MLIIGCDLHTRFQQIAYLDLTTGEIVTRRAAGSQGGPQMQQNLQQAQQYGQKGLQALTNMPKPDGMSDADFTKLRNETGAIFEGAVGFAALQQKDLATAQKDLRDAVGKESQPNIMDIYPLATADLEANPMNPEGFWFIVEASQLAQGTSQAQILDYGRKKYIRYHGSEDGWSALVTQAQSSQSILPPAGFTVAAAPPPPSPRAGGRPGEEQRPEADELCRMGAGAFFR